MNLDAALYLKKLERPIQLYYLDLPECCRTAFRAADTKYNGVGPESFDCVTHGHVDVAVHLATQIIESQRAQRHIVLVCRACTQKNRVDMAKVIAREQRPVCGKCHAPLHGVAN